MTSKSILQSWHVVPIPFWYIAFNHFCLFLRSFQNPLTMMFTDFI